MVEPCTLVLILVLGRIGHVCPITPCIQIRCRTYWVPGGSITHTEGVLYSVKQGCQCSVRLIPKLITNRRRYDDSASYRVISCRGRSLNAIHQFRLLENRGSLPTDPKRGAQYSVMCHALQSMRRQLYNKDRVGSSLMGSPQRGPEDQVNDSPTELSKHHQNSDLPGRARHSGSIQFTWSCRMSAWMDVG